MRWPNLPGRQARPSHPGAASTRARPEQAGGGQQDTANGELETKTNTTTGEEWLFQYDALGNLLSVSLPNGDLVEYLVDGMGRRVGRKKNGVLLKQWVYRDALKPVAELDGAGNLVAQYAYGSKSNVPDCARRGGQTYRVVSDHLGSPRYVVNVANSAEVVFSASYTSFGEMTGSGLDWMPLGFAGGIYDGDSGLVRFGARDYDASVGRWVSKDPILFGGRQANLYVYVNNDPVNRRDPLGLRDWSDDEVRELLRGYAARLDQSPLPMLLMANQHRGNEVDDGTGGDFDFWGRPVTTDDTFTLCGVGKMSSATAYWLVRAAGSAYGIKAWKDGIAPLGPLEYLGDSADSVDYIDRGLYWGLKETGHY